MDDNITWPITVDGRVFTGKLVCAEGIVRTDCPCWASGVWEQVPCPCHDGAWGFPLGAFAQSQRLKKTKSYKAGLYARLRSPAYAVGYLSAALEGEDEHVDATFLRALTDVAQAYGIEAA